MRKLFSAAALLLLLASCTSTENAKKLAGSWRGVSWTRGGAPIGQDASAVSFSFDESGNYTYTNSGQGEKGTYQVDGDNLYTTPEGGQAIMVKIKTLTKDSLVFDMNRAGTGETMTLIRK